MATLKARVGDGPANVAIKHRPIELRFDAERFPSDPSDGGHRDPVERRPRAARIGHDWRGEDAPAEHSLGQRLRKERRDAEVRFVGEGVVRTHETVRGSRAQRRPYSSQDERHIVHMLHDVDRERVVKFTISIELLGLDRVQLGRRSLPRCEIPDNLAQPIHVRETGADRFEGRNPVAGGLEGAAQEQHSSADFEHARPGRQVGELRVDDAGAESCLADIVRQQVAQLGRRSEDMIADGVEPRFNVDGPVAAVGRTSVRSQDGLYFTVSAKGGATWRAGVGTRRKRVPGKRQAYCFAGFGLMARSLAFISSALAAARSFAGALESAAVSVERPLSTVCPNASGCK